MNGGLAGSAEENRQMPDREVRVAEALKDIHAGMDHSALMEKYKLSRVGLKSLFDEMASLGLLAPVAQHQASSPTIKIRIRDFLKDFRKGLSDPALMKKYHLSHRALDMLYLRLLKLKAIRPKELLGGLPEPVDNGAQSDARLQTRYCLDFPLIAYDYSNPSRRGIIRDICERGVRIDGLYATLGEVISLVVDAEDFFGIPPFRCRSECRWHVKEKDEKGSSAGFRIIAILQSDLESLRKLIPMLTMNV